MAAATHVTTCQLQMPRTECRTFSSKHGTGNSENLPGGLLYCTAVSQFSATEIAWVTRLIQVRVDDLVGGSGAECAPETIRTWAARN